MYHMQLEYLVASVALQSFTKAAKLLYTSPQAVSHGVGCLERELDVKLFSRNGKSVSPTELGYIIGSKASEILACIDDMKRIAEGCGSGVLEGSLTLAVGVSHNRGHFGFDKHLESFARVHPSVIIKRLNCPHSQCRIAIEEGLAEAALVLGRGKDGPCVSVGVGAAELLVAMSVTNPLSDIDDLSLRDLAPVPVAAPSDYGPIYSKIAMCFKEREIYKDFIDVGNSQNELRQFIKEDGGVVFVGEGFEASVGDEEIVCCHLSDASVRLPICIARPAQTTNPIIDSLIQHLAQSDWGAVH